ncbi:YciI family protein [Simplicispira psychrophila]|uniref:YciI family protein n=1 Tax=Simplicispira psychrophila TaxID=80882 RepID=UPI000480BAC9|nr:YciI family protein [Simplicispira psychrophila]
MLFLILLDYVRPLAEVELHIAEHRAFLTHHYAAGHFLLSGRKEPRTGGVILARATSLDEVTQWIADDPFRKSGVASYEIIAWEATMVAEGMPKF